MLLNKVGVAGNIFGIPSHLSCFVHVFDISSVDPICIPVLMMLLFNVTHITTTWRPRLESLLSRTRIFISILRDSWNLVRIRNTLPVALVAVPA